MNCQDRVLCSNLNELVKKMVLSFCEVNVKFIHHLDIYGSIHIRADDTDVASMILNEHTIRDKNVSGSHVVHVSNDRGDPLSKEAVHTTEIGDQSFTKVIQSHLNTSESSAIPVMQRSVPQQPNMFPSPMMFDMCPNNLTPMSVNDPFRVMGFLPTPVPMPTDIRPIDSTNESRDIDQLVTRETTTLNDANPEIPQPERQTEPSINPDELWNMESTATSPPPADGESAHDTSTSSQSGVTYRCRICRQTFSDMKVYTHHVGQCKYRCDKCGRTFSMKTTLDAHILEDHHGNNNNNTKVTGRGKYQCNLCDQGFKTRAALTSHITYRH